MHSAVTMNNPLRITAVNTQSIWQLTFTQKHLSVTSTFCQMDTQTFVCSFKPNSCLLFFFQAIQQAQSHVYKYIHHLRDQGKGEPFLLSWTQFDRGQAQWAMILVPQIWRIVICQSVLWSLATGWTLPCSMRRESFPALFNKRRSLWCYQVDHRASGYSWAFSTLRLLPLITGVKTGSLFISIWVCESHFSGDVTSPLCAKLVTVLCASCSLSFALRRIYFPPEYIFCSLFLFYEIIDFQCLQHSRTLPSSALAETQMEKGC